MILQVLKKSTASPTLLSSGKLTRNHGTIAALARSSAPSDAFVLGAKRSYVTESLRTLPIAANHSVVGAAFRSPPGNPSTMAFLGVRSKSSGAASKVQCDDDDFVNGARVVERCVQEAWMVNLGRGDEEWLTGPRSGDWFTGVAPDVCPGEFYVLRC
jgi:hypothetical protein